MDPNRTASLTVPSRHDTMRTDSPEAGVRMRVQFRCCLCGQQNVVDLKPSDEYKAPSIGLASRLLGIFRPKPKANPRYTVQCEFCSQNNAIQAPPSRSVPRS
jgi:transcription elongation factor Elf1